MQENGFEYVDLGLPSGTMWATCNIGADRAEDTGLLFQFGRVDGYKYMDRDNGFRTLKQNKKDTKHLFIPQTSSGKIYNAGDTLDLEDDAAHVNMGGKWRMPTRKECIELINNTTHTINKNDVMVFTSNINGKQLFIPFGGFGHFSGYGDNDNYGFLWTSEILNSDVDNAYWLYIDKHNNTISIDFDYRAYAFSVRGVFNQ